MSLILVDRFAIDDVRRAGSGRLWQSHHSTTRGQHRAAAPLSEGPRQQRWWEPVCSSASLLSGCLCFKAVDSRSSFTGSINRPAQK